MTILAFMMNKAVTEPVFFRSLPNLWAISLTVPVLIWFLIRWSKWTRVFGISLVALSFAYVISNLKCAFADRDIYVHPESDFRFLALNLAAALLPVAAATAAFVIPNRKGTPQNTPNRSARWQLLSR